MLKAKSMIVTRVHRCSVCPTEVVQPGSGEFDRTPADWSILAGVLEGEENAKLCGRCTVRLRHWLAGQAL